MKYCGNEKLLEKQQTRTNIDFFSVTKITTLIIGRKIPPYALAVPGKLPVLIFTVFTHDTACSMLNGGKFASSVEREKEKSHYNLNSFNEDQFERKKHEKNAAVGGTAKKKSIIKTFAPLVTWKKDK